jgi:hypothetical protein
MRLEEEREREDASEARRGRGRKKRGLGACLAWTDRQSPTHMTRLLDYLCLSSANDRLQSKNESCHESINIISGYVVGQSGMLPTYDMERKAF